MRPVNLIPPDEQRSDRTPMRTGAVSYVLLGALALGLLGGIAVALTGKQISDREAEKVALDQELGAATAKAQSLSAFTTFRNVQDARTATISSLAQSRFDWERVIRELALVIPPDAWLLSLTGTVNPSVQVGGGAEVPTRDSVAGPALELVGCAPTQDSVAAMVASLEDIDGVTRVGIESSERSGDEEVAGVTSGANEGNSDDCRTLPTIYQFQIVVAFDSVPTPEAATAVPPVAPGADPQVADATAQQTAARDSAAAGTAKAEEATSLVPGS